LARKLSQDLSAELNGSLGNNNPYWNI
jgi:hypothetical protein